MPPITALNTIALPPQLSGDGHASHGSAMLSPPAVSPAASSFPAALAQAAGRYGSSSRHGGHDATLVAASVTPLGALPSVGVSLGSTAHLRHIPISRMHAGGGHERLEKVLALRAYRQQVIASNIANADTPGFQALDIDIDAALRLTQSALPMTLSAAGHLTAFVTPPYPLVYHIPSQAGVDGNTVEMDVERAKFTENALMYQFLIDRVGGHYKHLSELLQNLKE